MSKYTLDTSTSRAHPVPEPVRRLTVPAIRARKGGDPIVMLTAYTARMAQLLDEHCDVLLVGDSLAQVIYGLSTTVPVSLDMMIAHGAAVTRGSYKSVVVVDMPFGSYEESPEHAIRSATHILKETGCAAVKLEGGEAMAPTIRFLTERGIPVCGHVGLTPQAINVLGGYGARGKSDAEKDKLMRDAKAVSEAGAFLMVIEGVIEPLARQLTEAVEVPTIGIGASKACDGQVLVTEDMMGMFERTPRFVKRFGNMAEEIAAAAESYASAVRSREFPEDAQLYGVKKD